MYIHEMKKHWYDLNRKLLGHRTQCATNECNCSKQPRRCVHCSMCKANSLPVNPYFGKSLLSELQPAVTFR